MAASDAIPVPRKNTAFRMYFAIRDTSGALVTTWAGADSEVSKDGGSFVDCTNEATEIGTSGVGYIDLTSTEMNADSVVYKFTVTNTNAISIVVTLYPESAGDYRIDTTAIDALTTAIADVPTNAELTAALGTGTWATAIPWNSSWDAEVQRECTDALNAYDPPTNSELEARTILAASYATAVEVAKVIKTGEAVTKTRSGKTDVIETVTRN